MYIAPAPMDDHKVTMYDRMRMRLDSMHFGCARRAAPDTEPLSQLHIPLSKRMPGVELRTDT